jgi:hypothetical protein
MARQGCASSVDPIKRGCLRCLLRARTVCLFLLLVFPILKSLSCPEIPQETTETNPPLPLGKDRLYDVPGANLNEFSAVAAKAARYLTRCAAPASWPAAGTSLTGLLRSERGAETDVRPAAAAGSGRGG